MVPDRTESTSEAWMKERQALLVLRWRLGVFAKHDGMGTNIRLR